MSTKDCQDTPMFTASMYGTAAAAKRAEDEYYEQRARAFVAAQYGDDPTRAQLIFHGKTTSVDLRRGIAAVAAALRTAGNRDSAEHFATPEESSVVRQPSDGCGACGDACASNGGTCRVRAENPPGGRPDLERALSLVNRFRNAVREDADNGGVEKYRAMQAAQKELEQAITGIAVAQQPSAADTVAWPKVEGIGRDVQSLRCLILYLERNPSDAEVRALHDAIRTAPAPRSDDAQRESDAWRKAIDDASNLDNEWITEEQRKWIYRRAEILMAVRAGATSTHARGAALESFRSRLAGESAS